MRIRTLLLAASVAALPALAMAQTTPPTAATPPAATGMPDKPNHERGEHHERRAEMHAKYEKLSAADKAKFDDLSKQVKQLRQQQWQILGMSKS
jgi:hypothetical protein